MRSSPRKMRGEEVEGNSRKRKLENENDQHQVMIAGAVDKGKTRVSKGKKELKEEADIGREMMVEDMVMEEEEQVVPLQQEERVVEGEVMKV